MGLELVSQKVQSPENEKVLNKKWIRQDMFKK